MWPLHYDDYITNEELFLAKIIMPKDKRKAPALPHNPSKPLLASFGNTAYTGMPRAVCQPRDQAHVAGVQTRFPESRRIRDYG